MSLYSGTSLLQRHPRGVEGPIKGDVLISELPYEGIPLALYPLTHQIISTATPHRRKTNTVGHRLSELQLTDYIG